MPRADLYFSADVEADGPIPGPYSMLSFAFAVAGTFDGQTFERFDPAERVFYRELRPISEEFEPEALAASRLDREKLSERGSDPAEAMVEASAWIEQSSDGLRPVLVAYPLGFDWVFLYWYFVRFAGASPFGFSSCLDMKTMYHQKARTVMARATKRNMPTELLSPRPHTHHALDDAIEQADLFANLFVWEPADCRES